MTIRPGPTAALAIGLSLVVSSCGGGDGTPTGGSGADARPALRVTQPHQGAHTTLTAITVSGEATDAVQVTVGGRPSTLRPGPGARRLFSARVPLRLGVNTIAVVATGGAATAKTTLRVVRDRRQRPGRTSPNARPPAGGAPGAPPTTGGSSPPQTPSVPQGGTPAPAPPQGGPPAQFAPPQGGPSAPASPPQGAPPAQGGG